MPRESKSSGGAWTDAERYKFLIQVIAQLESFGKKVDLGKIAANMPGRTAKSLSHMMVKIRAEAAAFDTSSTSAAGQARGQKPSTGAAGSSRKRKVPHKATDEDDEDDSTVENPTPTKKAKWSMTKAKAKSAAAQEAEIDDALATEEYPAFHLDDDISDDDGSMIEA